MFLYLKALHIIFVVTWFAGLFYIVRLFIYHVEANDRDEHDRRILQDQFKIMERRLWYGITWPSAILTIIFGSSMLHNYFPLTNHPWLMIKLGFVVFLIGYHLYCGHIFKQLKSNIFTWNSTQLRVWNEVATLFLFAIVFLVVCRSFLDMSKGVLALIGLSVLLMVSIRTYRKIRMSNQ